MDKLAAYIKELGSYGHTIYIPLSPTGRWKIVSNEWGEEQILIEHKGLIFKSWIHEDRIEFKPVREEVIFGLCKV